MHKLGYSNTESLVKWYKEDQVYCDTYRRTFLVLYSDIKEGEVLSWHIVGHKKCMSIGTIILELENLKKMEEKDNQWLISI